MKIYSISDVSRLLGVDPTTLRRWIRKKQIPIPVPGIVNGRLAKCWKENELAQITEYKDSQYWGKGIDRKTGKKAKSK
jgi:predicted site-specific integrase-resolvase